MGVPSLALGGDKQSTAALKHFYATLRELCTWKWKVAISSALPHLAQLHCHNYCQFKFTFTASRASSRGMTHLALEQIF